MKTVSRVYDSYAQARAAVAALEAAGVRSRDISLIASKYVTAQSAGVEEVSAATEGAGMGGLVGGGAGLLAGLGLITIPGLGPVVAAGWLVATVVGAAAGAATGGLAGALADAGLSRLHADLYSESLRRGGTLVTVRTTDEGVARIESILDSCRPVDPVARREEYRRTGWEIFDAEAPPYRPSQAEIDRIRATWPG